MTEDVGYTVLCQVFPSPTFSCDYLSQTGESGVVDIEGEVGETGLGRKKTEENIQTDTKMKAREEQEGQLGSSPTERKATAEKKCHSTCKAQTSRNAIKRVIPSKDITEPLFMALPNVIISSF